VFNEVPKKEPKNFTGRLNLSLCFGSVFFSAANSLSALCFASTDESECNMEKIPHAQNGRRLDITIWQDMIQPCEKETWEIHK